MAVPSCKMQWCMAVVITSHHIDSNLATEAFNQLCGTLQSRNVQWCISIVVTCHHIDSNLPAQIFNHSDVALATRSRAVVSVRHNIDVNLIKMAPNRIALAMPNGAVQRVGVKP